MAGRFLIHKFSSGVSRSSSLIGAHASTTAGATVSRTGPVGGIGTLSDLFHGAAGHPRIAFRGIHGYAAKDLNAFPCSLGAKTSCTATGIPSITISRLKPFEDYVRGANRTFSSYSSTKSEISREGKSSAWKAWKEAVCCCGVLLTFLGLLGTILARIIEEVAITQPEMLRVAAQVAAIGQYGDKLN